MAQEFVEHFKASGKPLSSAVKQLDDMLRYFPRLMFVERVPDCDPPGQLELCCVRDALMQWVKDDPRFPALVFTSFERGLKHAGYDGRIFCLFFISLLTFSTQPVCDAINARQDTCEALGLQGRRGGVR